MRTGRVGQSWAETGIEQTVSAPNIAAPTSWFLHLILPPRRSPSSTNPRVAVAQPAPLRRVAGPLARISHSLDAPWLDLCPAIAFSPLANTSCIGGGAQKRWRVKSLR